MPAKPKQNPTSSLQGKPYKEFVSELYSSTALQARDIDQKAIQLLDALQAVGKAEEGCTHLKTQLEGIAREKVQNWRAYVYSLLRAFDSDVYNSMKEKSGGNRRQQGQGKKEKSTPGQNPNAVEFVPGSWWTGDAASGSFAPQVPQMGYPMNMMMMMPQMMVPQMQPAAGGPPPPPTAAAEVKADGKEAPAAPAADATVKDADKPADAAETKEAAR